MYIQVQDYLLLVPHSIVHIYTYCSGDDYGIRIAFSNVKDMVFVKYGRNKEKRDTDYNRIVDILTTKLEYSFDE